MICEMMKQFPDLTDAILNLRKAHAHVAPVDDIRSALVAVADVVDALLLEDIHAAAAVSDVLMNENVPMTLQRILVAYPRDDVVKV